ncbi:hypothetical protein ACFWG6_31120 [Streptomyces erythrochromogenes]|uniref:hypothetical protein n=1 Tax=Streptomyces erythrochromogenes TaxID=285574 RepID=UPI003643D3C9
MDQLILDTAWTLGLIAIAIITAAVYNAIRTTYRRHLRRQQIRQHLLLLRRLDQVERDVDAARTTRNRLMAEARTTIPTQRQHRTEDPQ